MRIPSQLRIQVFMTKNSKILQLKKPKFFFTKNFNIFIPWPPVRSPSYMRNLQPNTSKRIFYFFSFFVGHFFLPGSGSSRPKLMRIWRHNNNKKKTFCSPLVRKLHLVVTAVREFIQAIDSYKLIPYLSPEDKVSRQQCCGSGSGIRRLFDPCPGSGIGFFRIPDLGSRIPDLGSRIPDPNPIFFRA
jgi:hypothetical protein